jgi:tRNA (guanine9-N1)-methyltransferase
MSKHKSVLFLLLSSRAFSHAFLPVPRLSSYLQHSSISSSFPPPTQQGAFPLRFFSSKHWTPHQASAPIDRVTNMSQRDDDAKEAELDPGSKIGHYDVKTPATETTATCTAESAASSANNGDVVVDAIEEQATKSSAADESSNTSAVGDTEKVSKNQLKRQRRWEQVMEVKRRKKQQEKDVKIATAKAQGRDMEAERKDMEERQAQGHGRARRNEHWQQRFLKEATGYQICLDCSFENSLTAKEINSLASQIRYCYASNKNSRYPSTVTVTSLGGSTLEHLEKVSGFDQWTHRAFHGTEKSVGDAFPDKSKLIYLTSDSENVLDTVEDDKIYIIGGIVDRNRLKRAAIGHAESLGIQTAKLPITDYLSMVATKILTCNHVFEILLKYKEHKDWKKAFLEVLPNRKDAQEKSPEEKSPEEKSPEEKSPEETSQVEKSQEEP